MLNFYTAQVCICEILNLKGAMHHGR